MLKIIYAIYSKRVEGVRVMKDEGVTRLALAVSLTFMHVHY